MALEIVSDQNAYKNIEILLEKRRSRARRELEARREKAFAAVPELEKIDGMIATAGMRYNRALLAGEMTAEAAGAGIEREIGGLCASRAELLAQNGFPGEYLAPAPECAICGDTGYVAGAGGAPERCQCFRQLLAKRLEATSNVLSVGAASFEAFDEALFSDAVDEQRYRQAASPRDNILKIKESAQRFVEAFFDGKYENLYFFGRTGTGKTFMAAAIANALLSGGAAVLYLSAPSLFNIFTEHQMKSHRDAEYRDTLYRQVYTCGLLVIDDLGAESVTDSRYSEFFTLINERLSSYHTDGRINSKSTILSSNLDQKALSARYDERIYSRIVGSFRIVRFYGDDVRQKLAKA